MPKIQTQKDLQSLHDFALHSLEKQTQKVLVCCGTGCVAGGSLSIYANIKKVCEDRGLDVCVELQHEPHETNIGLKKSGCHGFCEMGPLVKIEPAGLLYIKVRPDDVQEIIEKSPSAGRGDRPSALSEGGQNLPAARRRSPFIRNRPAMVLANCGQNDARIFWNTSARAVIPLSPKPFSP